MIIICDIDGTIADCSARVPLIPDWDAFHERMIDDPPIRPVVNALLRIAESQWPSAQKGVPPVGLFFLTGRPNKYRIPTQKWLADKCNLMVHDDYDLLMRPTDDYTPDHEMKPRLLKGAMEPWGVVNAWGKRHDITVDDQYLKDAAIFIEDRDRVVAAWRGLGYCCLQPQEGAF